MSDRAWSDQETTDPLYANERNYYKVEQWTQDGQHIDRLLFAARRGRDGLKVKNPAAPASR
jgi:hypothetical protein